MKALCMGLVAATLLELVPAIAAAYYVKFGGTPRTLLFGPYAEDSQADVYVVRLQ